MGLLNHGDEPDSNVSYVSYRTKDVKPHFEVQRKSDKEGEGYAVVGTTDKISGKLLKVKYTEADDKKGGKILSYRIHMDCGDEGRAIFTVGMNQLGRSAQNALANLPENTDQIKFTIYEIPSKKNGKMYPHLDVYADGKKVSWKFQISELPEPFEAKGPDGKPLLDSAGRKTLFWTEQVEFLKAAMFARFPQTEDATPEAQEEMGAGTPFADKSVDPIDEPLPFE